MIDFALAGICGGLGASGPGLISSASKRSGNNDPSATAPRLKPLLAKNWRRVSARVNCRRTSIPASPLYRGRLARESADGFKREFGDLRARRPRYIGLYRNLVLWQRGILL